MLAESADALQRAAGLPTSVLDDAGFYRVEGLYRGNPVVCLNVGATTTEKRFFVEVLAHEALGYYRVKPVVGKKQWAEITGSIERHAQNGTGAAHIRRAIAHCVAHSRSRGVSRDLRPGSDRGNGRAGRPQRADRPCGSQGAPWLRRYMPDQQLLRQAESFRAEGSAGAAQRVLARLEIDELAFDAAFLTGLSPAERRSGPMVDLASVQWEGMGTDSPLVADQSNWSTSSASR